MLEDKYDLYMRQKSWKNAVEVATKMKDAYRLQEVEGRNLKH